MLTKKTDMTAVEPTEAESIATKLPTESYTIYTEESRLPPTEDKPQSYSAGCIIHSHDKEDRLHTHGIFR